MIFNGEKNIKRFVYSKKFNLKEKFEKKLHENIH